MRLELSRFVERDPDELAGYIAQDNPRRALTFIGEICAKFGDIPRSPLIYRLRPDIGDEAHLATVGSHAILFRVVVDVVRIERGIHGGRDLPTLLELP